MAFLTNGDYTRAIEEFTAAIRLESNAPNAYIGRALAYRSLGDDANALRDEQMVQELGGAERSVWERLVNRAYQQWRTHEGWSREDFYNVLDPLQRKAVLLSDFTSQLFNGGFYQWLANGYGGWVKELTDVIREIGTPTAEGVAEILEEEVPRLIKQRTYPNTDQGGMEDLLDRCDERYREYDHEFGEDVEAWFEDQSQMR